MEHTDPVRYEQLNFEPIRYGSIFPSTKQLRVMLIQQDKFKPKAYVDCASICKDLKVSSILV